MKITKRLVDRIIARASRTPDTHLYHADGSLYMGRFWLLRTRWFSVRIHHIATCDLDRHFHDHPWSFISLVLRGGYTEARPVSIEPYFVGEIEPYLFTRREAGSVAFRRATDRHRVSWVDDSTWTLVILGPKRQWWGFFTPEGKVHWRDYATCHAAGAAAYFNERGEAAHFDEHPD